MIIYNFGDGADASYDGGADNDTLRVVGSGGSDTLTVVWNGSRLTGSNGTTLLNIEAITADLGDGNDRLAGVPASGSTAVTLGRGQIDVLTGGLGADTFVLGDARGVFYDDRTNNNLGSADYARITDFRSGEDKLQLRNANYFTTLSKGVTSIYWDRNANNRFDTAGNNRDELIAMITVSITSTDIVWA